MAPSENRKPPPSIPSPSTYLSRFVSRRAVVVSGPQGGQGQPPPPHFNLAPFMRPTNVSHENQTLKERRLDRLEQRKRQEREKVCKKVLDIILDKIEKKEKEEEQERLKLLKLERRREYDRIYRQKRKFEKEMDILVQERMQNIRKEISKRRVKLEQDAELQAGIGLWALKGKKPPDFANSLPIRHGGKRHDQFVPFPQSNQVPTPAAKLHAEDTTAVSKPEKMKKRSWPEDWQDHGLVSKKLKEHRRKSPPNDANKDNFTACCGSPYDASRFYIKCNLCSGWFHGKCVGVNSKKTKKMATWACKTCAEEKKKTEQQLYCLCRTPYDNSQFYVGCDGCEDWFHPRCVGINKSEAEAMPEYYCPSCLASGEGSGGGVSHQPLTRHDYTKLFSILECLKEHRTSWPFRKPVDPDKHPNYFVMIREPMDLQTVECKLCRAEYTRLQDFVSDVSRIFDNARLYNAKDSPVHQCAVILEKRFDESLQQLKEEMAEQAKLEEGEAERERQSQNMYRDRIEDDLEEEEEIGIILKNFVTLLVMLIDMEEIEGLESDDPIEVAEVGEILGNEENVEIEEVVQEEIIMNPDEEIFMGDTVVVLADQQDGNTVKTQQDYYGNILQF